MGVTITIGPRRARLVAGARPPTKLELFVLKRIANETGRPLGYKPRTWGQACARLCRLALLKDVDDGDGGWHFVVTAAGYREITIAGLAVDPGLVVCRQCRGAYTKHWSGSCLTCRGTGLLVDGRS